jgi:hypothetical protein
MSKKSLPNNLEFRKIEEVPIIRTNGVVDRVSTVRIAEQVEMPVGVVAVKKACSVDSGMWYCVSHKEHFLNQIKKDSHIHQGSHRLAWNCYQHGLEQP